MTWVKSFFLNMWNENSTMNLASLYQLIRQTFVIESFRAAQKMTIENTKTILMQISMPDMCSKKLIKISHQLYFSSPTILFCFVFID